MKILPSSVKGNQDRTVSLKLDSDADRIALIRLEGKPIKIIEDREQAEVMSPVKIQVANLMLKFDEFIVQLKEVHDSMEGNGTERIKDVGLEAQHEQQVDFDTH